jgi:hypothetical protein
MKKPTQFYFSVEKLENLLKEFKHFRKDSKDKKVLRGFVFTPGESEVTAAPLYSDKAVPEVIEDGHLLLQASDPHQGCPYPPPCN